MMANTSRREKRTGRMSLGAHLVELRKRLYISALAIAACSVLGWFLSDALLDLMRQPITEIAVVQHRVASLNYDSIAGAFDLKIQVAITIGLIVASPIWLYQIFAFFMPALTRKEMKFVLGFFFSAVPLFIAGVFVGWQAYPRVVDIMTSVAPPDSTAIITAKTYFDFVLKLVIVIGIGFVLPVFIVLLNFAGVMSARTIIKSWRWAVLLIVVFTAIATPATDVLSMLFLAVPMLVLYFIAAAIAVLHDRRVNRRATLVEKALSDKAPVTDVA